MHNDDLRKAVTDDVEMYTNQEATNLFRFIGRMAGQIGLLRENAGDMLKLLPIVTNTFIGDSLVLRLGELIKADATQVELLRPLPAHPSELARARFCHILGYAEVNGLCFGDDLKRLATDDSPMVRRRAVQALRRLGRHGLEGTQEIIRKMLDDTDPAVQDEAAKSLS